MTEKSKRGKPGPAAECGADTPCPTLRVDQAQPLDEQLHGGGLQIEEMQGGSGVIEAVLLERNSWRSALKRGHVSQVVEDGHRRVHRRHPIGAKIVQKLWSKNNTNTGLFQRYSPQVMRMPGEVVATNVPTLGRELDKLMFLVPMFTFCHDSAGPSMESGSRQRSDGETEQDQPATTTIE